jgi:hypothetical protein
MIRALQKEAARSNRSKRRITVGLERRAHQSQQLLVHLRLRSALYLLCVPSAKASATFLLVTKLLPEI